MSKPPSKPATPGTSTPAGSIAPAAVAGGGVGGAPTGRTPTGGRTPAGTGHRTPANAESGGGSLPILLDLPPTAAAAAASSSVSGLLAASGTESSLLAPGANADKDGNGTAKDDEAILAGSSDDDAFDWRTGELIVDEAMSQRRRQRALERAMAKKRAEDMTVELTVTNVRPRRTAAQIRATSMAILEDAREVIAQDLGVAPVKVVSDGYVLPREAVVTVSKPITFADDEGNVVSVSAPSTGFGLNKKYDDIEKARTRDASTVQHYRRSLDALKAVRNQRLMRQLDIDY